MVIETDVNGFRIGYMRNSLSSQERVGSKITTSESLERTYVDKSCIQGRDRGRNPRCYLLEVPQVKLVSPQVKLVLVSNGDRESSIV